MCHKMVDVNQIALNVWALAAFSIRDLRLAPHRNHKERLYASGVRNPIMAPSLSNSRWRGAPCESSGAEVADDVPPEWTRKINEERLVHQSSSSEKPGMTSVENSLHESNPKCLGVHVWIRPCGDDHAEIVEVDVAVTVEITARE